MAGFAREGGGANRIFRNYLNQLGYFSLSQRLAFGVWAGLNRNPADATT